MIIRTYQSKDEKQVIDLWIECGLTVPWNDPKKDIQRKFSDSPDLFFVGEIETEIVASCMAGYDGHRGWIYYLAVKPEYQGKGYAKAILEHSEKALLSIKCPKIELMVRHTNDKVVSFYKHAGYKDDPVIVMSKRLISDR
jgi:ribosomal protein S18 acetylase RimI-like enzyme